MYATFAETNVKVWCTKRYVATVPLCWDLLFIFTDRMQPPHGEHSHNGSTASGRERERERKRKPEGLLERATG